MQSELSGDQYQLLRAFDQLAAGSPQLTLRRAPRRKKQASIPTPVSLRRH
jgi:hypothetical protein